MIFVHGARRRWARRSGVALLAGAFALIGLVPAASAEIDRAQALADMRQIYASMQVLLPLSVDDSAFRSADQKARIRSALAILADRAAHVGNHVAGGDRRIQYLGQSLARETQETLRQFDEGRVESAQYSIQSLTGFCVACHSRISSPTDSLLSHDFVSDKDIAKLPLSRQAVLQVATRRFDDALQTYEAIFASPNVHPAELLAPLTQYLTVAIRVKNDLARPVPVLAKLAERPGLWSNLRTDLRRWKTTLERYAAASHKPGGKSAKPSLANARALINDAHEIMAFPTDRQGLVRYLLASAEMHRYLEEHSGESSRDVAEAYYMLGLVESRTNFNYLVSEADFYLETAIRMAPADPIGQEAYRLLEEETVLGWSGSGGSNMPRDVEENLATLRALVYPDEGRPEGGMLDLIEPD